MNPGDELVLRDSNERVRLVAVLDAAGTLLVADADGASFQIGPEEVMTLSERHSCCESC